MSVSDEQKAWVSAQTRLQVFIYLLMRDHVPFGVIEKILKDMRGVVGCVEFSARYVPDYSLLVADEIMRGPTS